MITKANIFLGLNDKDSKTQLISTVDAANMVNGLICRAFGAGTVTNSTGVYTHESGAVVVEQTLKLEVLFFDRLAAEVRAAVTPFCQELKRVFNQESVVLQLEAVESELI